MVTEYGVWEKEINAANVIYLRSGFKIYTKITEYVVNSFIVTMTTVTENIESEWRQKCFINTVLLFPCILAQRNKIN